MNQGKVFKLVVLILFKCISVSCTTRPIIGVMTQEFADYNPGGSIDRNKSTFIPASYVKALESTGVRIVPIFLNRDHRYYERILHSVNGIVAPGGPNEIQPGYPYYDALAKVVKIAEKMNDKGIYFPIMGICFGLEALFTMYNNDTLLQTTCDGYHQNYPLHFEPKFTESLLYSDMDQETYYRLKTFPATAHAHNWCTTKRNFTEVGLHKIWKITASCTSTRGLKFICSAEHRKYPFIALQFHPEKPIFEWDNSLNLHHNNAVVRANRLFYDVLVKLAKLNNNKFRSEKEEREALINNYQTYFPDTKPSFFYQIYVFD